MEKCIFDLKNKNIDKKKNYEINLVTIQIRININIYVCMYT